MGAVYLVEHVDLKTRHAIKILRPQLSNQPQVVQRFRNEARAAAATRSPNIVAVRDFGQLDDGSWYLVMDYWEGETLAVFLASRGPVSHELTIRIAVDALNGLAAAHSRNIIHRDLKPDNLYLARVDGDLRTMILDFGVCRLGEDTGVVTRTGVVLGTPRYMAPEQFRGEVVDHRADLWSMGAILYEVATHGWLPYDDEGGSPGQVLDDPTLRARMSKPPLDPQRRCPGITRALADAILALIDPDPAKRPANASDSALLMAETLAGEGHEPSGIEIVQERAPDLLRAMRDTARSPVPVVVSRDLPARYAIHSEIGSGGMAEVFRADALGAEGFARAVALKRVLAGYSEVPAFAAMFCEEARIASYLNHPNVVAVLDFDRDAAGRLFLVMEYVAGKDLGAILATGRLPPAMAIFIVSEMLRGLGYAHALPSPIDGLRGVVHRDISPHNVLVSWEGAVKVSDFGIAKALDSGSEAGAGAITGKPAYMSPEQVNGGPVDGRSDLFSVGVILWEALTGLRLFKSESPKETFGQILFRDAVRPSAVRPGIAADLDEVTMKLLARDLELRYATAELAIEDLARCAENPRNGRSDLVRLLATRFPPERQAPLQDRTLSDRDARAPGGTQPPVSPAVSTLVSAVSQWSPRPPMRQHRRRWLVGAITGAAVSMGTFAMILLAHRSLSTAGAAGAANAANAAVTTPADAGIRWPADAASVAIASPPDAAVVAVQLDTGVQLDAGVPPPRPSGHVPVETGLLSIYVVPFAQVWVDDAPGSAGQTPMHLKLRTGRHRIRLENARLHKETTVPVIITAAKEVVIDETW
jgi:serine/threonine-protein kinase